MTITQAQDRIQALLEGDTSTPVEGDEDWDARLALINDAIEEWAGLADVKWQELYTTNSSNTGDGTTTSFALPANFDHFTGNVVLSSTDGYTQVPQIPVSKAHTMLGNITDQRCYLQGSNLVFTIAPDSGTTIIIPYYKKATALTAAADVIPMSKPRFVVYWATAFIGQQSDDYARFNADMQRADNLLSEMKIDNETLGVGQDGAIHDNYPGWGV